MHDFLNKRLAICSICDEKTECRSFELYVFGSEGIRLCHDCEMEVDEFIRNRALARMKERFEARKTS